MQFLDMYSCVTSLVLFGSKAGAGTFSCGGQNSSQHLYQFKPSVKDTAVVLDFFGNPSPKKSCGYFTTINSQSFNLNL